MLYEIILYIWQSDKGSFLTPEQMNKQPKQRFGPFVRVPLGCSKCYRSAVATRGLVHKHWLLMPYQFHPPARMQTLQKSTRPNFASWCLLVCGGVASCKGFSNTHRKTYSVKFVAIDGATNLGSFLPTQVVYWMSFFSTKLPETNSGHIQRSKFKMISASKKKHITWKEQTPGKKLFMKNQSNDIKWAKNLGVFNNQHHLTLLPVSGFLHRFLESSRRNPLPAPCMARVSPSYSSTLRCKASRPCPPVRARWRKRRQCDKATGHAARPNNK